MGKVLTEDSSVQCGHKAALTMLGKDKLRVEGTPVLVESSVISATIATTDCLNSTSGGKPCTVVTSVAPGSTATTLRVGGEPVVLGSLHGVTDGSPVGFLAVDNPADDKLKAQ